MLTRVLRTVLIIILVLSPLSTVAQDSLATPDEEPHYSRLLGNGYCQVYLVELGRLEQTKPIAHQHNWLWIPIAGKVQEASGSTVYQDIYDPLGQGSGYSVHFRWPVKPYSLRNDHIEPFAGIIVELLSEDDSRNRWNDPSLDHTAEYLGPGDTQKNYLTSLLKTNVEIDNVQMMSGTEQEIHGSGIGHLLVAITDVDLIRDSPALKGRIQLESNRVTWVPDVTTATYKNLGRNTARFVLLQFK